MPKCVVYKIHHALSDAFFIKLQFFVYKIVVAVFVRYAHVSKYKYLGYSEERLCGVDGLAGIAIYKWLPFIIIVCINAEKWWYTRWSSKI